MIVPADFVFVGASGHNLPALQLRQEHDPHPERDHCEHRQVSLIIDLIDYLLSLKRIITNNVILQTKRTNFLKFNAFVSEFLKIFIKVRNAKKMFHIVSGIDIKDIPNVNDKVKAYNNLCMC